MLAGGGCAILLQLAHPSVGRGVAEHSDFASRPYDRLIGTLTYVTAVACGTEEDVRTVHRAVGRAHAPVHGPADSDTPAYSAFDPDLQLWVTATLYWTAVRVHERVFGALDAASADRFYREFAAVGTSLQLPHDAWPVTRDDFDRYWDDALRRLMVLPAARVVSRELLRAEHAPLWMRLIMPWARLATVALLPESLRSQYGLVLSERNRRRYERMMSLTAALYPRLPLRVRHIVRDRLLHRLRAEM
ncbi:oxygenase MpaB family protein [Humibacter ginsengisoli]